MGLWRTSTCGMVTLHSVKGSWIFVCGCEVVGHGCVAVSVFLDAGELKFRLYQQGNNGVFSSLFLEKQAGSLSAWCSNAWELPAVLCPKYSSQVLRIIKLTNFTILSEIYYQPFMKCEEVGVVLCFEIFQCILSCRYSVRFMVRNTNLLNIGFYRRRTEVSGFLMAWKIWFHSVGVQSQLWHGSATTLCIMANCILSNFWLALRSSVQFLSVANDELTWIPRNRKAKSVRIELFDLIPLFFLISL